MWLTMKMRWVHHSKWSPVHRGILSQKPMSHFWVIRNHHPKWRMWQKKTQHLGTGDELRRAPTPWRQVALSSACSSAFLCPGGTAKTFPWANQSLSLQGATTFGVENAVLPVPGFPGFLSHRNSASFQSTYGLRHLTALLSKFSKQITSNASDGEDMDGYGRIVVRSFCARFSVPLCLPTMEPLRSQVMGKRIWQWRSSKVCWPMPSTKIINLPSGEHTKSYGKWP